MKKKKKKITKRMTVLFQTGTTVLIIAVDQDNVIKDGTGIVSLLRRYPPTRRDNIPLPIHLLGKQISRKKG
jgi:hypothetical protein